MPLGSLLAGINFSARNCAEMGVNVANTTNFSVRMDSDIKKQCEILYGELGVNLTTAINVFLRQSLRAGGFPFDVRMEQPNKETIAAMLEAERIARDPSVKRYSDVEEALRALKE
jgi:DNA-damage-inducible protein J